MGNKVALLIPHHFNLYQGIIKNLESAGFQVEILVVTDRQFKYKNISQKLKNFYRKTFLKNKDFKKQLKIQNHSEDLLDNLEKYHGKLDYALVIRPDYFSVESLQKLKEKTCYTAAYQWDGFERYPEIMEYIEIFDAFFTFDPMNYKNYQYKYFNLKFTTNFYLDNLKSDPSKEQPETVFFLGSYLPNRTEKVFEIAEFFRQENIDSNIQIVYPHSSVPSQLQQANVTVRKNNADYLEMIEEMQKASCLLEFSNKEIHNGLSFRVFEALHYRKKIITDNPDLRNFDFYDSDNIFVWEGDNLDGLKTFLKKPYKNLDPKIVEKYGFTSWINNIFNIQPQ